MRRTAVRDRDAGEQWPGEGRRDARYDVHFDAGARERQRLFASATEDEGVAALQTDHAVVVLGKFDQQIADVVLGRGFTGDLADVDAQRLGRDEFQDTRADQSVVHHDVGAREHLGGAQRQQVGVARSGPDEEDTHDCRTLT